MTNIYIRVIRDKKWVKIELEHATAKERNRYINSLPNIKKTTLINKLIRVIKNAEKGYD